MKINLNKNQKNKQIYSNLRIQLRNYSGTNPWSLAFHGMQNKNRKRESRDGERNWAPLRVPKLWSVELVLSAFLLVSLYRPWLDLDFIFGEIFYLLIYYLSNN